MATIFVSYIQSNALNYHTLGHIFSIEEEKILIENTLHCLQPSRLRLCWSCIGRRLEDNLQISGGGHSSCLESLYTLSLYDELSAAVEEGVGEHRLMTLGNQSCSQLQTGANQKRGPPTLRRDEDPS